MWSASLTCFAALCSLSTLVSEASAIPLADQGGKTCRKTKVAILGAGITGITAAQALTNSSVTDFIIVDRNDYIGGRVHHTTFGEKPDGSPYTVELGANWVQGIHSPGGPVNPIWKLARKYDLETSYDNDSSLITYDQTGRSDYSHLIDSVGNKWDAAAAEAGKVLSDNLQDTNVRAGFSAAGWNPKKNMHAQAVDWWNWDYEAAITPQESSFAYGFAGYNATFNLFNDENQFCWDQRGFNTIIIGEANEFLAHNDPRLMLNTVVEGIKYSDKGVTIELDDGACIEAEHALCTFSVGVLQNDVVNFTPSLPTWKTEAIELMQMATYTKIFFQFNETFWDRDTEYFLYADPDQRGYYPIWQSLDAPGYLKDSNIIFVTVTEDQSYQVEQQSNHKTQAEAMAVLRAMFPHKQIPEPTAFMYPRWSLEDWAFGSYSNWPTAMTLEKHQNLRANIGRLWFAGEATSAEFFGFLQGGWLEGQEMGARIAGLLGGEPIKVGVFGNYTVSGALERYEVLHSTTKPKAYDVQNGWPVSSFQTYGDS